MKCQNDFFSYMGQYNNKNTKDNLFIVFELSLSIFYTIFVKEQIMKTFKTTSNWIIYGRQEGKFTSIELKEEVC